MTDPTKFIKDFKKFLAEPTDTEEFMPYEWHPIETAPKTGEVIITANARQGGVKSLIFWDRVHKYWNENGQVVLPWHLQATHWCKIVPFSIRSKESKG